MKTPEKSRERATEYDRLAAAASDARDVSILAGSQ
jgi:hypothetical protein